tara:strand:+ start:477 stop:938 length:462 start_codon:yes stop_codon:yes gene_type:complete
MSGIVIEFIPFAFIVILLIFLLALPKKKNQKLNKKEIEKVEMQTISFNQSNRKVLENAEIKLIALKDLYKQELIDANVYISKTEIIAKNLSKEFGNDIMEIPDLQKRIIFNGLKEEISKKINNIPTKNVKNNLDNLISAVDNRIKAGVISEDK